MPGMPGLCEPGDVRTSAPRKDVTGSSGRLAGRRAQSKQLGFPAQHHFANAAGGRSMEAAGPGSAGPLVGRSKRAGVRLGSAGQAARRLLGPPRERNRVRRSAQVTRDN